MHTHIISVLLLALQHCSIAMGATFTTEVTTLTLLTPLSLLLSSSQFLQCFLLCRRAQQRRSLSTCYTIAMWPALPRNLRHLPHHPHLPSPQLLSPPSTVPQALSAVYPLSPTPLPDILHNTAALTHYNNRDNPPSAHSRLLDTRHYCLVHSHALQVHNCRECLPLYPRKPATAPPSQLYPATSCFLGRFCTPYGNPILSSVQLSASPATIQNLDEIHYTTSQEFICVLYLD